MKPIRGLLFDFNGTLFFDTEMHLAAFHEMLRRAGLPDLSDAEMIRSIFGRSNESIYVDVFGGDHDPSRVDAFVTAKETLYQEFCLQMPERMHLTPGAEELLDHLRDNGIPYCLATGSGLENIEYYRQHMNLGRWFPPERIVYFDGTYPGKPAPDIYRLAAARLGLTPGDCAVFEDGTSGMCAATAAGAGAIIGLWEERFPSPLTPELHADRILHDLRDWRTLLSDLGL